MRGVRAPLMPSTPHPQTGADELLAPATEARCVVKRSSNTHSGFLSRNTPLMSEIMQFVHNCP